MSLISKHYDRFQVAEANGLTHTGIPEEHQEYPKLLYKGKGDDRQVVEVADEHQEEHYAEQGFAMHDPKAAEEARKKELGIVAPPPPKVFRPPVVPAPLKLPETAKKPVVPSV